MVSPGIGFRLYYRSRGGEFEVCSMTTVPYDFPRKHLAWLADEKQRDMERMIEMVFEA